jgi:transposase-like protein
VLHFSLFSWLRLCVGVLPLSVVENLAFSPNRLTTPIDPAYPSFQELSMLFISSGEDLMTFHVFVFLLLSFLMLSLAWLCRLSLLHHGLAHSRAGTVHPVVRHLLKPRTPRDCPACRLSCTLPSGVGPAPVRPWCEMKSRRGAPKRVNTEGFACPNRKCPYFGITETHIHALVGDGTHGRAERIQTFRCQACRTTLSARRDTALSRLNPPSHQIAMVLSALAEGLDASAAERVFGSRQATIISLSDTRGLARTNPARALLLPSPPPPPPVGRTAHQAPLRPTGALAVAGHRPLHKDSSRAPSGSPHTTHGT